MLVILLGRGLSRFEVAALTLKHIQQSDNRWCIVDLVWKHGRVRAIPMPTWVKVAIDTWTGPTGITPTRTLWTGRLPAAGSEDSGMEQYSYVIAKADIYYP
jgi:hypothetical protein